MTATEKLYWKDPHQVRFESEGCSLQAWPPGSDAQALVLRETLFYPEAGGQLADCGTLEIDGETRRVVDVHIDGAGTIFHLLDSPLPPLVGSLKIQGQIDSRRRHDHMAQHSAQHMLSQSLVRRGFLTVSSRLGSSACTIDVVAAPLRPGLTLTHELAWDAAKEVYDVVLDDRQVHALYPNPDEWQSLGLRKIPTVAEGIRVIDIEGFDRTPCGGTHVTRTGQVGYPFIASVERYKRGFRLTFHAGPRAHAEVTKRLGVLSRLEQQFTCGLESLSQAADKALSDRKRLTAELACSELARAELRAQAILADLIPIGQVEATRLIACFELGGSVAFTRALAGRLVSAELRIAVVASVTATGAYMVVQRNTAHPTVTPEPACIELWNHIAKALGGGKGGGSAGRAEGGLGLPISQEAFAAALTRAWPAAWPTPVSR